jgi:hypothetical protein
MLGENSIVANFHLEDGLLWRVGHLYVLSSEREKIIWESHYSQVVGHFSIKMIGSDAKTFLLDETSIGYRQVY